MAVLEIAKIQVRRGDARETGLPQLDTGEFGWAIRGTDINSVHPELYIGNKTADGADQDQNVRILTEYDNLFELSASANYSYVGHSTAPIFTDPSGIAKYSRSLQSKLDDIVTILDFGGIVDGSVISTSVIQNAVDQLYANSDRTKYQGRVALRFPAGQFNLDSTVYLPPYATIIGAGKNKTVINVTTPNTSAFQTCDASGRVLGSIFDSERPTDVIICGITFQFAQDVSYINAAPLILVDAASNSSIINCGFRGFLNPTLDISNSNYSGISIRGQGALTTEDLVVYNCTFENLYCGIVSNYNVTDTAITSGKFRHLIRGVVFSETAVVGNGSGPVRSKILQNTFYDIQKEGIFVNSNNGTVTSHSSQNNTFREVGLTGTPCIDFKSTGNVSLNDQIIPVNLGPAVPEVPAITGHVSVNDLSVKLVAVQESTVPLEMLSIPFAGNDSLIELDYSVVKDPLLSARKGKLMINVANLANGATATITDQYSFTGASDCNIEFSVELNINTNAVIIKYQSGDSYGVITYKYKYLQ